MKGDDWIQGMSGGGIPWAMIPSPGFYRFLPKAIWGIGAWLRRFEDESQVGVSPLHRRIPAVQ